MFLCGLIGLVSNEMFQFVFSKISGHAVVTAVKCLYESKHSSQQLTTPIRLDMRCNSLLPYDCHCISYVMSCYPVSELIMYESCIGDKGAEFLLKDYSNQNVTCQLLKKIDIAGNNLTIDGLAQ